MCGASAPTWLTQEPEKMYAKRHISNKYDTLAGLGIDTQKSEEIIDIR